LWNQLLETARNTKGESSTTQTTSGKAESSAAVPEDPKSQEIFYLSKIAETMQSELDLWKSELKKSAKPASAGKFLSQIYLTIEKNVVKANKSNVLFVLHLQLRLQSK